MNPTPFQFKLSLIMYRNVTNQLQQKSKTCNMTFTKNWKEAITHRADEWLQFDDRILSCNQPVGGVCVCVVIL